MRTGWKDIPLSPEIEPCHQTFEQLCLNKETPVLIVLLFESELLFEARMSLKVFSELSSLSDLLILRIF